MNRLAHRVSTSLFGVIVAAAAASACTAKSDTNNAASADVITVSSTDKACTLSATTAKSGKLSFDVKNDGSKVTEFYVFRDDGKSIVTEVENIGPGLTRRLVAIVGPGSYITMCKPGMVGNGIRAPFTVEDSGVAVAADDAAAAQLTAATDRYKAFVRTEADALLAGTESFASAYISGSDDAARASYAPTRMHWERIEPVAESFGDIDPKIDRREADLEPGEQWTGWHRIEKDLWPPAGFTALTPSERKTIADQLVSDTKELLSRLETVTLSPDQLGNGAKELLDEVATRKVTGEEEIYSRTDLWDFQANVDGAKEAFESLEPVLAVKEPDLVKQLDTRFAAVQTALDAHRRGEGFARYNELTKEQVKALADEVNALSEPLSRLTAAVLG